MEKRNNEKMGVISWLINFRTLREEYFEMLSDSEKSKMDVENAIKESKKVRDVLEAEIENLNIELERIKNQLSSKSQRLYDLENAIADRNKEIQELHYELSKKNLQLDKKIKAFNKVRGAVGGYQKQINKLCKELDLSKNKIIFLEKRVPKKSFEELKAYEFGRREVLRRNKENRNEKV